MSDNAFKKHVFIFISPHSVVYALMRILDVHTLENRFFLIAQHNEAHQKIDLM